MTASIECWLFLQIRSARRVVGHGSCRLLSQCFRATLKGSKVMILGLFMWCHSSLRSKASHSRRPAHCTPVPHDWRATYIRTRCVLARPAQENRDALLPIFVEHDRVDLSCSRSGSKASFDQSWGSDPSTQVRCTLKDRHPT